MTFKLRIFVAGELRYENPYTVGQAFAVAWALKQEMPGIARVSGRVGVVVDAGKVAWLMARMGADERMIPYDAA